MATREHLDQLAQGVEEWNAWRKRRASKGLLNNVDLSGARLEYQNLSGIDLKNADLSNTNLTDTYLLGSDLRRANLCRANMSLAILSGASLFGASLRGANLHRASLMMADLRSATLSGANLAETKLSETIFANVDLSDVLGLEECVHIGPSIVDHQTLLLSNPLPRSFLRGAGLPEKLITYLPTLFEQAIQYYSCFISYSTKDQDFADRLHTDLQNKGIRCWFAPHDMPIGGKILDEIDTAIRLRDKVLLILSKHSIKSGWVEDEVTKAFEEERTRGRPTLIPIRLDNSVMETNKAWAAKLRARNIGDFRRWKDYNSYKKSFAPVVRDLIAMSIEHR